MLQVNAYLSFNGECENAFKFYEKVLKGKIQGFHRYGESPMADQTPADQKNRIMHVSMTVGESTLMGADAPVQYASKPQGFCVSINLDNPPEAERIFKELSDGAQVQMPIGETFWAERFGMLVDKFGIPWMVNCGKPM